VYALILVIPFGLSKPATEISDPARLSAQLQRHKAVRIL